MLAMLLTLTVSVAQSAALAATSVGFSPRSDAAQQLNFQSLESSGAVIREIRIANNNIFDLEDPAEDRALYRFANRAHITTHRDVIYQQLLFTPGDRFSSQAIEESERLIRANRYIQNVSVRPVAVNDEVVDVEVTTSDVWTLMPKLALSRSGGTNNTAYGLKETNLFGTGVELEVIAKSNIDRNSSSIRYRDRHLGGSWYTLGAYLADNSDGKEMSLQLIEPFYSLNSRSSRGIEYLERDQVESFYKRGDRVSEYRHSTRMTNLFLGWSAGLRNGYSKRFLVGLAADVHKFSGSAEPGQLQGPVPEDRNLIYPYVGFELVEDDYEKTRNQEQIGRVEDRFLGTHFFANVGFASAAAGSDRDALLLKTTIQTGFGSTATRSLFLSAGMNTRIEKGGVANLLLNARARYYRRQSERSLLYVGLSADLGANLDLDQYYELGGDSGLRGYPLRYQSGDKRVLLTIEQRYFTDWYPWRLFRVGGAVFADIGRAWGDTPVAQPTSKLLGDVGFGLRIGNDRSGFGRMTHIDIAMPLNGDGTIDEIQFLISSKKSF